MIVPWLIREVPEGLTMRPFRAVAGAIVAVCCAAAAAQQTGAPPIGVRPDPQPPAAQRREAADDRYKWNLAEIYPSDEAWEQARRDLLRDIAAMSATTPTPIRSASDLLAVLALRDRIDERAARLATYAGMRFDLDTRVGRAQQMSEQAREARVALAAAQAWIRPAILALGSARVHRLLRAEPRLARYRQPLEDTLRFGPHTLDAAAEKLLAETGRIAGTGQAVWSVLTNADLPWPTVTL